MSFSLAVNFNCAITVWVAIYNRGMCHDYRYYSHVQPKLENVNNRTTMKIEQVRDAMCTGFD